MQKTSFLKVSKFLSLILRHEPEKAGLTLDKNGWVKVSKLIFAVKQKWPEFTRGDLDDMMTRQNRSDWPNQFRSSRFIPAVEYVNVNRHRYLLMQKMNEFMSQYDVVICPTFTGSQLRITNLTGHPALCMPTGFNKNQLPTSITLVGKLYDEATLLAVAKAYQNITPWNKMHPEKFKQ